MYGSHVYRYILREVLGPTLLCLLIFTMVLLMGRLVRLVDLIINKGVSFTDIMVLFATMMPSFLTISLPLAFLMGIMIGLGRMSADSETVALKSAGIGLTGIAVPVFALALIFSLLTGMAGLWAKPWGYRAFKAKTFEITKQKATIGFQPRIFMNQFNNLVVYASEIDEHAGQMHNLFIVEKQPDATAWVFADNGNILTDDKNETVTIRLHDGVIHRQNNDSSDNYQLIHFRNYDVQPDISSATKAIRTERQRPKEMPTGKLWTSIDQTKKPAKVQSMKAELHQRLCSPLAPLLFALFGLPFSMQSHRSGRSSGFVMGLFIYLCYYFILSAADTLTVEASAPPWLSFWATHCVLFIIGIYLLRQSALEKPNLLATWIDQSLDTLKKRVKRNADC